MFETDDHLMEWGKAVGIDEKALRIIRHIRKTEPARIVRNRLKNVRGRYPSCKMLRTIQFQTHRNELALIYDMEHDPDVIEYWDMPPSILLSYSTTSGRRHGILHSPNFFIIRNSSAGWVECKTEAGLAKLAKRQPNRFQKDALKGWRCLSGEDYASIYRLSYTVKTDAEIDWIFQRNILFLEDFLLEDVVVPDEVTAYIHSLVAAQPGITLTQMLSIMKRRDLRADSIYQLIVTDRLYADLSECVLAKPEKVYLYLNQEAAAIYEHTTGNAFNGKHKLPSLLPGNHIQWDNKVWEIMNHGEKQTWLQGSEGKIIKLDNLPLQHFIEQGIITHFTASSAQSPEEGKELLLKLEAASPLERAEANRRYQLLLAFQSGEFCVEQSEVCIRTLYNWQAKFRAAEEQFGAGYIGLLPETHSRGNGQPKLPDETISLLEEHITMKHENPKQPTSYSVWTELIKTCEERGLVAPSYQTFCLRVRNRPIHEQKAKRQGRRGGYSSEPFYFTLELTTPRHGDRPFEIGHIDHTELDIELICSQTGENLGRPWLTLLIDAYTRLVLAFNVTFDTPSYRSCMMILRECVSRYNRLPQILVLDGGREFSSTYFETLLAYYKITKKTRPPSEARFGSVCERVFGSTNTRLIYNLAGNTQLTKINARLVTPAVNPKNLAWWTLPNLNDLLAEYFYQVYPTIDHPALGQSPQAAFLAAQARSGERDSRFIANNENFLMMTLPTTAKRTAKVIPGRGVKINYIMYWCEAFRNPEVERTQVHVRYDPYNLGQAYAYVLGYWRTCTSEHYMVFSKCSEQEIKLASIELRRRNKQHGERFILTARKIANFLKNLGEKEKELCKQRKRDAEFYKAQSRSEGASFPQTTAFEEALASGSSTTEKVNAESVEITYQRAESDNPVDLFDLETYEEYK